MIVEEVYDLMQTGNLKDDVRSALEAQLRRIYAVGSMHAMWDYRDEVQARLDQLKDPK